jgi:hypothetical protein
MDRRLITSNHMIRGVDESRSSVFGWVLLFLDGFRARSGVTGSKDNSFVPVCVYMQCMSNPYGPLGTHDDSAV